MQPVRPRNIMPSAFRRIDMRFGGRRTSSNVESGGRGSGIGGGRGIGLLMHLVASRFGIGGIIVLVTGAILLRFTPSGGGGSSPVGPTQPAPAATTPAALSPPDPPTPFTRPALPTRS